MVGPPLTFIGVLTKRVLLWWSLCPGPVNALAVSMLWAGDLLTITISPMRRFCGMPTMERMRHGVPFSLVVRMEELEIYVRCGE
jgi:hypothetical protein